MKIFIFTLLFILIINIEIIKSQSIICDNKSNYNFTEDISSTSSNSSREIFKEIQNLKNCARDIYPVIRDIYKAYKEYRTGNEEGKENAKKLLKEIGNESINLGIDCFKIIEKILIKFEYL